MNSSFLDRCDVVVMAIWTVSHPEADDATAEEAEAAEDRQRQPVQPRGQNWACQAHQPNRGDEAEQETDDGQYPGQPTPSTGVGVLDESPETVRARHGCGGRGGTSSGGRGHRRQGDAKRRRSQTVQAPLVILDQDLKSVEPALERAETLGLGLGGLRRPSNSRPSFLEGDRGTGGVGRVVGRDGAAELHGSLDDSCLDALDLASDGFELAPGGELSNACLESSVAGIVLGDKAKHLFAVGAEGVFHEVDDGGTGRVRSVAEPVKDRLAGG